MSIGEAKRLHQQTGQPVIIVGRDGRPIKSDLFDNVPFLVQRPPRQGPYQRLVNGPGLRPYIAEKTSTKWTWKPYKPEPAQIVFTANELEFAERYRGKVMIEPETKAIGHSNKAWRRWPELAALLRRYNVPTVQCHPGGATIVLADTLALTPSFRYAAAVLSVSRAFIGTEGGLMHAAAAVGTSAVILWSEFISPEITGYATHKNLRHAGPPCGSRTNCADCYAAMQAITPAEVLDALEEFL